MRSGPGVFLLLGVLLTACVNPASAEADPAQGETARALASLAEGADPARVEAGLAGLGFTVVERFDFAGVWAVTGPSGAIPALTGVPGVAHAEREEPLTPLLARSRDVVHADGPGHALLPETGRNVTVAIVDSGVDTSHPGFEDRVKVALRFEKSGAVRSGSDDADGHGTHVAGIAAGSGAESVNARLRGVAPEAGLAVLDISDAFTTTNAIRAFRWIHENHAQHDIRVVTNSWGREKEENHYNPDDPVVRASNALVADGIVMVFSAGNRGEDGRASLTVEAVNPNFIAVGATDFDGRVEPYSSRGPALDEDGESLPWVKPDLAAPGTGIVSTRTMARAPGSASGEDRYYVAMNGTSMAAPHVAGAAALVVSRHPHLAPGQVAQVLAETARDVGPDGPDTATGYGIPDVAAALTALQDAPGPEYVKVVTRQELHAEGRVTGLEGLVVLEDGEPRAPPEGAARVPLALDAGAEHLTVWFNWSSATADFRVTLVDPRGERAGPFPATGPRSVRVDAPASPGTWVLEAVPTGAAAAEAWSVDGHALIVRTRSLEATARPDEPSGFGLFGPAGFVEAPGSGIMGDVARYVTPTRGLGAACVLAAAAVFATGRWRDRKRRRE